MPGRLVPIPRPARIRLARMAVLALLLQASTVPGVSAASPPAVRGADGMVVTPEARASEVGVAILRAGGNAVDASVAVALALAVTYPRAGNLGGGGFLLYRSPEGSFEALDFRETAPRKLRASMFLDEEGRPWPGRSLRGGLAVAVPGSVAGLSDAHRRWGRLEWKTLVAPAIDLAQRGFDVSGSLADGFAEQSEILLSDPEARRVFAADGTLPREGERVVQADLAASLRRIAEQRDAGFYSGQTAEALVGAIRAAGGVLDREDLATYRPTLREPVEGRYRGYRIVSFPPPSSGGLVLLQMLGLLERFDLAASGPGSSASVHLMAEAARRAYADRSRWLGDPDHFEVPARGLLDPAYLAGRAASIEPARATPSAGLLPGEPTRNEPADTLHFSIADRWGGAVALTTTLNTTFGCGIVAPGTGILLNNEIDDFALAPGVPNTYGLLGGEANAVAAGKRPLSSMTPTIVEYPDGGPRPALVLGSPGGSRIINAVLQVLVNVVDHGMPLQEAVDAPRFHHQWQPDLLLHEPRAFPEDVRKALVARGHELQERRSVGNVNAVGTDPDGNWLGAADPRRNGTARGH